jgi:hypothetical protein
MVRLAVGRNFFPLKGTRRAFTYVQNVVFFFYSFSYLHQTLQELFLQTFFAKTFDETEKKTVSRSTFWMRNALVSEINNYTLSICVYLTKCD